MQYFWSSVLTPGDEAAHLVASFFEAISQRRNDHQA
jgi:hypothetical protein